MAASPFRSVLYVDDDPDICEVVKTTLRCIAGLDVDTVTSGEEAIDRLFAARPDLVLMDVMMPGLDGPSTLGRIRESAVIADIPVIFLTAKVLPDEIARFLELGAIGVIEKPFDPLRLCDRLFVLWNTAKRNAERVLSDAEDRGGVREDPAAFPGKQAGKPAVDSGARTARIPRRQAQSLAGRFLERLDGDIARLNTMLEGARRGERAMLAEIERIAHSVHGAGAMFGFAAVSVAGAALERQVKLGTTRPPAPGTAAEADLIDRLADAIARLEAERTLARDRTTAPGPADPASASDHGGAVPAL
jgi:CheY-like chemotaxis protein